MKTERYLFERGGPEECFEPRPQRRPMTYSLRVSRRRDGLTADAFAATYEPVGEIGDPGRLETRRARKEREL
jgi:hypothetical protein